MTRGRSSQHSLRAYDGSRPARLKAPPGRLAIMKTRQHDAELADRIAEERSENEGMPEHPAKARDPVRWALDRHSRVSRTERRLEPGNTGLSPRMPRLPAPLRTPHS